VDRGGPVIRASGPTTAIPTPRTGVDSRHQPEQDEPVKQPFAHQSILVMEPDADLRAPGAAITVALCGHWDHQPPCPLAAHHTRTDRLGDQVRVRTLFATGPGSEQAVRRQIEDALAAGEFAGPDGTPTRWHLLSSAASPVHSSEYDHGARLAGD
jgi:hypothetical protein